MTQLHTPRRLGSPSQPATARTASTRTGTSSDLDSASCRPALPPARIADSDHKATGSFGVEPFCSSGPSPTDTDATIPTVHILGAGAVAQALLQQTDSIADAGGRVVAITDSSSTWHRKRGIDAGQVIATKRAGGSLRQLPNAEQVPTELAIDLVAADVLVDLGPTHANAGQRASATYRRVLARGGAIVTAAKHALATSADDLLRRGGRTRLGVHAALGGTGQRLLRDLDRIRRTTRSIACVGNASTTELLLSIERGATLDQALEQATRRGVLEPNPSADIDGHDAALKLAAVARIALGLDFDAQAIHRPRLVELDFDHIRARARRGCTTRLVGRVTRTGQHSLEYEELPKGHALAVPPDRVAYAYRTDAAETLHIGVGLGPTRTAAAVLDDLLAQLHNRASAVEASR